MNLTELLEHLDPQERNDPEKLLSTFLEWVSSRGIALYPAQEEAVMELASGNNMILATPTGSGKSLVAVAAHFFALAGDVQSYYTAPIKALVSEKFFALIDIFGVENVGMVTGDSSVNSNAPIICATAEIVANKALREGTDGKSAVVVMDEFHYYSDPQRGWAWQVPLNQMPGAQFLLMSATLGDTENIAKALSADTGRQTVKVSSSERPIPLHFYYATTPINETIDEVAHSGSSPMYVVHFSQAEATERAQDLLSIPLIGKEQKEKIAQAIGDFRFGPGFGKQLSKFLRHGIGVHHAGMLPKYRRLVEQMASQGLLSVICGTDTLGVGINVPIRTVIITALSKYDGTTVRHLSVREFHQLAGRAGRAGFDTAGTVIVQAPEHVIENERALAKARAKFGDDERKLRQVVRKKPQSGFVSWGKPTFERLRDGEPEQLRAHFQLTHAIVLNMLARPGNPIVNMRALLEQSAVSKKQKFALARQALGMLRELLATGVVERQEPDESGRTLRLTVELQENFALNRPLSPFAVAAMELFDPESPTYELDILSVLEATMEPARPVLYAQEKRERAEAHAAMKADNVDYTERMARLDEVSYPKPLAEILGAAFETYRRGAPWIADFELDPKSIVRDMYERAMTFNEYVSYYQLARSEGVLLRYLSDTYKALKNSVPPQALREDLEDLIVWLGEMVHQVDSSLLDEWEDLRNANLPALQRDEIAPPAPPAPLSANTRAFRVMVRNALFHRVRLFADEQDVALGELDASSGWDAQRWSEALDGYFADYEDIDDGPNARGPQLLQIRPGKKEWQVRQVLLDPENNLDWGINASVDLAASDESGAPVIRILSVGPALPAT